MLRLHQSQHIRRAGVRDRHPLPVLQPDGHIISRITRLRRKEFDLCSLDLIRIGEYRIIQSADMRRSWSDIDHSALVRPDHGPAGHAEHPYIQGIDIGRMTADDGIVDGRAAVFDHTDIGSRAADLEVHPVRRSQIHQ